MPQRLFLQNTKDVTYHNKTQLRQHTIDNWSWRYLLYSDKPESACCS